jgi:hypothetical protein
VWGILRSSAAPGTAGPDIVARVHRTTTTATLLVTVAVSALAGCVTVQRPPASGPPPAPSQPTAPHPDDEADPQIVQAPVHEALETVGPSRQPEPRTPGRHGPSATTPAEQPTAPHSHRRPHPRAAHPGSGHHGQPRVEVPDVSRPVPRNTDVCALGREYGGWQADSPEAVICKQTYGR